MLRNMQAKAFCPWLRGVSSLYLYVVGNCKSAGGIFFSRTARGWSQSGYHNIVEFGLMVDGVCTAAYSRTVHRRRLPVLSSQKLAQLHNLAFVRSEINVFPDFVTFSAIK